MYPGADASPGAEIWYTGIRDHEQMANARNNQYLLTQLSL